MKHKLPIPTGKPMRYWNYATQALDEARDYRDSGHLEAMRRRVVVARMHNHRSLRYRRQEAA
jgi:hypothetical protein